MKFLIALLVSILLVESGHAASRVRGYYRSTGTYVAPHMRSSPNATKLDNWSSKGNTNPYTGATGTKIHNK